MKQHGISRALSLVPPEATLYIVQGVPCLMTRVDDTESRTYANSWLYLPPSTLATAVQSGRNRQPAALSLDGYSGLPIVIDDRLLGMLVYDEAFAFGMPAEQLDRMGSHLMRARSVSLSDERESTRAFISRLFRKDITIDSFLFDVLSLMFEYWDSAYGAVYRQTDGEYVVRHAGGNLEFCHRLPAQLNHQLAHRIDTCIEAGRSFLLADPLPDKARFLDTIPDVYFVHLGPRSMRQRQLVALAGEGCISYEKVRCLVHLAGLVAELDESQFISTSDLVPVWHRLVEEPVSTLGMDDLLLDSFEKLRRQAAISRIAVTLLDDSGKTGLSAVVTAAGAKDRHVEHISDLSAPPEITQVVLKGQPYLLEDITQGALNETESRQRYLANVRSEFYLPVKTGGEVAAAVIVGSPVQGDYLNHAETALACLADILGVFLSLATNGRGSSRRESSSSLNETGPIVRAVRGTHSKSFTATASRLPIMKKLAGGYMHEMLNLLSVIIGTAEVQTQELTPASTRSGGLGKMRMGLSRIEAAADQISAHVASLEKILNGVEQAPTRKLQPGEFLRELPKLLYGLLKQTGDTRNTDILLKTDDRLATDFPVMADDLYEHVLPCLIFIIDQAENTGMIHVQLYLRDDECYLEVGADASLFGANNPGRIIQKVFHKHAIDWQSTHSGQIATANFLVEFGWRGSEAFRIVMRWPERAGNPGGKASRGRRSREVSRS